MSILEGLLFVVGVVLGARLGIWIANKHADMQSEFTSINMHITNVEESITRRIEDESRELWQRINDLDIQVSDLKENK